MGLGLTVWGLGFSVEGLRGYNLWFGVQGTGFRVYSLEFRIKGLGFTMWGLGSTAQGLECGV